jgi:hypothetical protein
LDTVGICVTARQIIEISTFSASRALRRIPRAWRDSAANYTGFLTFKKNCLPSGHFLDHTYFSRFFFALVFVYCKVKQSRYTPWRRVGGEEV